MSELWKSYNGHKAAFGEDQTKIEANGHNWVEDFIDMGYCGWGPDTSYQTCSSCKATRQVMLHPGPNNVRYNGRFGIYGQWNWKKECKIECPGEVK